MISEWLEKRIATRYRKCYVDGFKWAMAAYFLEHMSTQKIKFNLTHNPPYNPNWRSFDRETYEFNNGASIAVAIINKNRMNADESSRHYFRG